MVEVIDVSSLITGLIDQGSDVTLGSNDTSLITVLVDRASTVTGVIESSSQIGE